jgi:hypothetical protein
VTRETRDYSTVSMVWMASEDVLDILYSTLNVLLAYDALYYLLLPSLAFFIMNLIHCRVWSTQSASKLFSIVSSSRRYGNQFT